jgi:hypothetical protein
MALNLTVVAEDVPDEQTEISSRSRVRDEDQLQIDGIVTPLAKEWEEKGKPEPGNTNPYRRLRVKKDDVSGLKAMIRRAAALAKAEPVYWTDKKEDDGTVTVKFGLKVATAKSKKAKAEANGTSETETPAPTPHITESMTTPTETAEPAPAPESTPEPEQHRRAFRR